jgi:hypothetical protein
MEDTIAAGRREILKYDSLLKVIIILFHEYLCSIKHQEYIHVAEDSEKGSWNFPKAHLLIHLFDDIEAKGVTANITTKHNEKMHRPLKTAYQWHTNFKDVADQVCLLEWKLFCFLIMSMNNRF